MGLEEVGEYDRAERIGKRGAELEPNDLWSIHSVAHVLESEGPRFESVWYQQNQ